MFLWVESGATVVETVVLVESLCKYENFLCVCVSENVCVCVYSAYVKLFIKSTLLVCRWESQGVLCLRWCNLDASIVQHWTRALANLTVWMCQYTQLTIEYDPQYCGSRSDLFITE